ncbi:MAG: M12 family metallo-peptidase, partial [Planctomycetota bacterium]
SSSDPWSTPETPGGDTGDMLSEFRSAWNSSGWPVSADLAHFLSGDNLGGGIAYVNVLCNSSFGYGVSANLNGNINWGSWTGAAGSFTWDFVVVAHELGHNFGTGHTHSYCPPIDVCYDNCSASTSCSQGTIMSYCHTCGGMDNIDLRFHQQVANVMRQRVESSCLGDAAMGTGD